VQHADFFQFFAGQLNDWNGTGKTDLPSSYGAIESCHSETSTKGVRYWHNASRKSGKTPRIPVVKLAGSTESFCQKLEVIWVVNQVVGVKGHCLAKLGLS
jgi:hypothetical protein